MPGTIQCIQYTGDEKNENKSPCPHGVYTYEVGKNEGYTVSKQNRNMRLTRDSESLMGKELL